MVVDDDLITLVTWKDMSYRMRGSVSNVGSVVLYIGGNPIPNNHQEFGWDLVEDELSYEESSPRKKIVFRKPCRLPEGVMIEVDYVTIPAHCRKCKGSLYTNDFQISQNRSFIHITEHPKLLQRVMKFMLTSQCAFYPNFTSPIKDLVGRKFGVTLGEEDVSSYITSALLSLKTIQNYQKTLQSLTPQEIMKDILGVKVVRSSTDPSRVKVSVQVSSYGKERPQPLSFSMRSTK
jgi:hypothetical protein